MSFRQRMKVEHSLAEIILRIELQHRGLHKRMSPINTVVFLDVREIQIAAEERVTKAMIRKGFTIQFTKPDYLFPKEKFPVYLDGPPHRKSGVMQRDNEIDRKLLALGFAPVRFGHNGGNPSAANVKGWADAIEMILQCWDHQQWLLHKNMFRAVRRARKKGMTDVPYGAPLVESEKKQKSTIIWCVKEYIEGRLTLN